MSTKVFTYQRPFVLESGRQLPGYHLAYTTYGSLNEAADNVVWVFHALTANSDPAEWWSGLVGEGKLFDPAHYFIVCVNMPGSCYGSICPLDINPITGEPWYHDFPFFTPRDMARAYQPLREQLGIRSIYVGIGGSMGGQQLLEWAVEEPALFQHIVPMATNAQHSPWGIAFNASQRMAIEADTTWPQRSPQAGLEGMRAARSVALLSYRHYLAYGQTQAEESNALLADFKAEGYQRHQGEKLVRRFNAFSYYFLSRGMDSHNLGRGRGSVAQALQAITARVLVIGIATDMLFPVSEQRFIYEQLPGSDCVVIESPYGHDGFLVEYAAIERCLATFLSFTHQQVGETDSNGILVQE
jgi:homoserine O-acetyltransferase/O-succinyltransferase